MKNNKDCDKDRFIHLSPNEEAMFNKKIFEDKRKQRLLQVREQEKASSLRLRQKVKKHKERKMVDAAGTLQNEYYAEKERKEQKLLQALEKRLKKVGGAHKFDDKENFGVRKETSAEQQMNLLARTRKAFLLLKENQQEQEMVLGQEKALRLKVLEMETARKNDILAQPKPPPDPIKCLQSTKVPTNSKQGVESFSTTWFHLGTTLDSNVVPEIIAEKANADEEVDARDAATEERHKLIEQKEKFDREIQERKEKAELRHTYARNEVILEQEKRAMLDELESFDIKDRHRRRERVADIPKKIFQPPYQRLKDAKLKQYDLEQAFEKIHTVTCEDPMEKYYRNTEDILVDRKDEVSQLVIPEMVKDENEKPVYNEMTVSSSVAFNTKSKDEIGASARHQTRFERLRNKIKKQQQLPSTTSENAEPHSDIDSASVVKEALEKNSPHHSIKHQYESLRSMNIDSACESYEANTQDAGIEETSPQDGTLKEFPESLPFSPKNPLTQQNLAFNQRLLEHQKRVAELQKQHLENQKSTKVDVFLPPMEKGGTPTTIISDMLDKTTEPIPDDSLPLTKSVIAHDPDLDVSIQITDQSSGKSMNDRDLNDVSLSLSCIPSRTNSLKQYPLVDNTLQTDTTGSTPTVLRQTQHETSPDSKSQEDIETQTSFEAKKPDIEEVKEKPTVDLHKLQRKREELRNQYPDLFNGTSTGSGPSPDIMSRIRNHRESLRRQRQHLEKRRFDRTMESSEEVLRKSESFLSTVDDNTDHLLKTEDSVDFAIVSSKATQPCTEREKPITIESSSSSKTHGIPKVAASTEISPSSKNAGVQPPSSIKSEGKSGHTQSSVNDILQELRNLQTRAQQETDELLKSDVSLIEETDASSGLTRYDLTSTEHTGLSGPSQTQAILSLEDAGITSVSRRNLPSRDSTSNRVKESPISSQNNILPRESSSLNNMPAKFSMSSLGNTRKASSINDDVSVVSVSKTRESLKTETKQSSNTTKESPEMFIGSRADVPVLTSSSFQSRDSVGDHRLGYRVSEHPQVSPIKEVDEALTTTPTRILSSVGFLQEQSLSASSQPDQLSSGYTENGLSLVRLSINNQSNDNKIQDDDVFVPLVSNPPMRLFASTGNLSNTLLGSQRSGQQDHYENEMYFPLAETFRSQPGSDINKLTTVILDGSSNGVTSDTASLPPDASPLFLPYTQEIVEPIQDFIFGENETCSSTSGDNDFKSLQEIPVQSHVKALPNEDESASVTLEELLENNLSVLPKSFTLSSSGATTSSSLNSSEKYKALLERVKQLPLIHAREQELLVKSYQENSITSNDYLFNNDDEIDGEGSIDKNDYPLYNYDQINDKVKECLESDQQSFHQMTAHLDSSELRSPGVEDSNVTNKFKEMAPQCNIERKSTTDVNSPCIAPVQEHALHLKTLSLNEDDCIGDETAKLTTLSLNQNSKFEEIPLTEDGFIDDQTSKCYALLISDEDPIDNETSILETPLNQDKTNRNPTAEFKEVTLLSNSSAIKNSSDKSSVPSVDFRELPSTVSPFKHSPVSIDRSKQRELSASIPNMSELEFQELPGDVQFDKNDEDLGLYSDLQNQNLEASDKVSDSIVDTGLGNRANSVSYNSSQFVDLQVNRLDVSDTVNTRPGLLDTNHSEANINHFTDLPMTNNLDISDTSRTATADVNLDNRVDILSPFLLNQEEVFHVGQNDVTKHEISSYDLMTQSLCSDAENEDPRESQCPPPIIFTSGEESPNNPFEQLSGGEHGESEFLGNRRKFVMSYFHDTSPEMLSFTKNTSTDTDSKSELLSLTQESFLPLPEHQHKTNSRTVTRCENNGFVAGDFQLSSNILQDVENRSECISPQDHANLHHDGNLSTDQIATKPLPISSHDSNVHSDNLLKEESYIHEDSSQDISSDILRSSHTETLSLAQQRDPVLPRKQNSIPKTTCYSSDIQTLSHTDSLTKYPCESTSEIATLSLTASAHGKEKEPILLGDKLYSLSTSDTNRLTLASKRGSGTDNDIPTLSFTTSNSFQEKKIESDRVKSPEILNAQSHTPKDSLPHCQSVTPKSKSASENEKNTSSLLTSERTISELINLPSTTSPESSELQDSSFIDRSTLDLINQLISSKSQHSDTESSELFTVGRLSLSHSHHDAEHEIQTELSLLSDLNFSTMSEDCVDWSSLVPTTSASSGNGQYSSLSETGVKVESLQDAFQRSRKKFMTASRVRQENLKRRATEKSMEKVTEKATEKKSAQQTNIATVKKSSSLTFRSSDEKLDKVKQKESLTERKKRTKRLYERLPEVRKQTAEKERQEAGKRNREKAQQFHEKLQSKMKKNAQQQKQKKH